MTPRELAYEVLSRWTEGSGPVAPDFDERLVAANFTGSERALALELVYGVIRRRATLDALLVPHVNRPLEKIEAGARTLLHLGLYQLFLLSGAPPYAIVNETAELAKRIGRPQWTGFVNGILRSASRAVTDDYVAAPASNAVPLADGRFRVVLGRVFSDPALDLGAHFAAAYSFPQWLVERWRRRFSNAELARLGTWFNAPPKLSLRVNSLRSTRAALLESLASSGISAKAGDHPDAVRLEQSARVPDLPGFREGLFTVQDESAMWAASLLAPRPGEHVLDLCAAPGGKTTHLATLMQNQGRVTAADVEADRLKRVDETCRRLGLPIVETRLVRRDSSDLAEGPFDAILLDVPCSNTGVLGKRPEARWRVTAQDLAELVELQRRLLDAAFARLRPRGRLVYSTCSIEPEENRDLLAAFLAERPGLTLVEERSHVPGLPADGGYQALLSRSAATSNHASSP
ncbi:MAG: 16S rRNA (cytosine(967)-C(5))-methyltransferase [Planctomycetaceae bacterium]|nr:16S rRNA (cytosine(967)-C(5))-methyltransferase [Planctomycetaceae bacterium]